jgi:Ca2+-binding RTX toxin-like protein
MGVIVDNVQQSSSDDGESVSISTSSRVSTRDDSDGGWSTSVSSHSELSSSDGDGSFSRSTSVVTDGDGDETTIVTTTEVRTNEDGSETVVTHIEGSDGDDQVVAQSENGAISTIEAGEGDDSVVAGAGDDTIDGGPGQDEMTGGEGADTFRFEQGSSVDIITDFTQGVDKIDLSAFGFASASDVSIDGNVIDLGNGDIVIALNVDALSGDDLVL